MEMRLISAQLDEQNSALNAHYFSPPTVVNHIEFILPQKI